MPTIDFNWPKIWDLKLKFQLIWAISVFYEQFKFPSQLTHLSLTSFLWDIGKQHSPRCDAAERGVPSGAILFAQRNKSGLTQMIMIGKSMVKYGLKFFNTLVPGNKDKSISFSLQFLDKVFFFFFFFFYSFLRLFH